MTRRRLFGLGGMFAGAAGLARAAAVPQRSQFRHHVLLISIDGLPARVWEERWFSAPALRQLEANGVRAEGMSVVNPSVTWPNHTSMITGVSPAKHGLLFNGLPTFPRPNGPVVIEPWRDKSELVLAPTVYDVAYEAGATTAQVDWVAIQNASTITWEFAERPRVDGKIEQEMMRLGLIDEAAIRDFSKSVPVWRDQMWTEAGAYILRTYKPNLMLFHLLNVDAINHRFGEGTWASHSAYAYADRCVQKLLEALRDADIEKDTTVLIVSDHGFMNLKKTIRPNAFLASIGLLKGSGTELECDAFVVPEGGSAMLFIRNRSRKDELRAELMEKFSGLEGIAKVLQPEDAVRYGMPHPDESDRMADLVLAAEPGYGFAGQSTGAVITDVAGAMGTHGFLSDHSEMDATFVAYGRGIRKRAQLGHIRNVDVAPTVAALLGLEMENVEGRVLTEVLQLNN